MNTVLNKINEWINKNNEDEILNLSFLQLNKLPNNLPNNCKKLKINNNKLTSLHNLPNTLIELNCGMNQLTTLTILPDNLQELDCNNNRLTNLPNLPSNLQTLKCFNNQLNSLPVLPDNLQELYCNNNVLTILPNLPSNLQILKCFNNKLVNLHNLPNSLLHLYCSYNVLTNLPNLPNSLLHLYCSHNVLTILPNLPNNLLHLDCSDNRLSSLPNLPNSLEYLYCDNNILTKLPVLPINLEELSCINTKIKTITLPKNIYTFYLPEDIKINNMFFIMLNKIINYEKFNEFYNENIEKCFIKKSYTLNTDNINNWLNELIKINDINLTSFGYCIIKTIKHISFVEFYDNVCKLGIKLQQFINNLNDYIIFFYISNLKKSYLWVLLLIWKFIPKSNNIYIIDNFVYEKYLPFINQKYKLIYIDDCMYTGTQMDDVLNLNLLNKSSNYVFIPYISENAYKKYYNKYNIIYINMFKDFESMLNPAEIVSYKNIITKYKFYNNKRNNINICNIYFDHKLSDFVSIFQPIYAYGIIPKKNDLISIGSFIRGCEEFYENNKLTTYDFFQLIDLQDKLKDICPIAFYKNINYTYKNKNIKQFIEIIKINE